MSGTEPHYPGDPCAHAEDAAGVPALEAGCKPGPGNLPVADQHGMVPGASQALQASVDAARRELHRAGQRAYRAFLVWHQRVRGGRYEELQRIELMPVQVEAVRNVGWRNGPSGMHADGTLQLTEVSLAQVSEHDLLGHLNGQDPPDGVEFFIELVRYARCADDSPIPQRFTPSGLPEYDAENFQWVVTLTSQQNPRTEDGEDQTLTTAKPGPRRQTSLRT